MIYNLILFVFKLNFRFFNRQLRWLIQTAAVKNELQQKPND